MSVLLSIEGLEVSFGAPGARRMARAVRGLDLALEAGASLALVGESGSGKTAVAKALMRLHDPRRAKISGLMLLNGIALNELPEEKMNALRGKVLSMVFQDPMSSLNPVFRVGDQVAEALTRAKGLGRKEARVEALELFEKAGMPSPELLFKRYPHEFSGGMLQRAMILIALAASPELLIADEPTTALDLTVQAQILDLMEAMRSEKGTALILVTHDIGVVAERTENVAVMYAGRVLESGATREVLSRPLHPYTEGLLDALPVRASARGAAGGRLRTIEGSPPSVFDESPGCSFAPRCPYALASCREARPLSRVVGKGRLVACHRASELSLRGIA